MGMPEAVTIVGVCFAISLVIVKLLTKNTNGGYGIKIGKMEVSIGHIERDILEMKQSMSAIHKRLDNRVKEG